MTEENTPIAANPDIASLLRRAGLDPVEVDQTYKDQGKLSEHHYEALEAIGLPAGVVNTYLRMGEASRRKPAAQDDDAPETEEDKARQERVQTAIKIVGSEEALTELIEWGTKNLTNAEKGTYTEQVNDPETLQDGILWLMAKRGEGGGQGDSGPIAPYISDVECAQAVLDPRYETEPFYRARVQMRAAKSEKHIADMVAIQFDEAENEIITDPSASGNAPPYVSQTEYLNAVRDTRMRTDSEFRHRHDLRLLATGKAPHDLPPG